MVRRVHQVRIILISRDHETNMDSIALLGVAGLQGPAGESGDGSFVFVR